MRKGQVGKRIAGLLLALCMAVTSMPLEAFASGADAVSSAGSLNMVEHLKDGNTAEHAESLPEKDVGAAEQMDGLPEDAGAAEQMDGLPEDAGATEQMDGSPEDAGAAGQVQGLPEDAGAAERAEGSQEEGTFGDYRVSFQTDASGNQTATVMAYLGEALEVSVPEELNACPVTGIGSRAFYRNQAIRSVTLPGTVTSIGSSAFEECSTLAGVTLPEGLAMIGQKAFYNCDTISDIVLPASLGQIGEYAFYDCDALTAVFIPKSVTVFGHHAFAECSALADITLEEGLAVVGEDMFSNCDSIKRAVIPESIRRIPKGMLFGCDLLEEVVLSEGLEQIGQHAFRSCGALKAVEIPDGVTKMEEAAFLGSGLEEITLPASLEGIGVGVFLECAGLKRAVLLGNVERFGDRVFANCRSLQEVVLPEGMGSLGDSMFSGCSALREIVIPDSVSHLGTYIFSRCTSLESAVLPKSLQSIPDGTFSGCGALREITISDSISKIGVSAFENCSALQDIQLPEGLQEIGSYAFGQCDALTQVAIPAGISQIGSGVFRECSALSKVILPDGLAILGNNMFYHCEALSGVSLPASLKRIGERAFYDCDALTAVFIPKGVAEFGEKVFRGCSSLEEVTLEEGLSVIGKGMFEDCDALKRVIIPESVKTIPSVLFHACDALEEVALPKGLKRIENDAFVNCTSLKKIAIPDGVAYIGSGAFWKSALQEITIPAGVEEMSLKVFWDCKELKRAEFMGNVERMGEGLFQGCTALEEAVLPEGMERLGDSMFYGCSALREIVIPSSVSQMGATIFGSCTMLENVSLPKSLQAVPVDAFWGCTALKKITLPDSVSEIGGSVFYGCGALQEITLPSRLARIGSYAFGNCGALKNISLPGSLTYLGVGVFKGCGALEALEIPEGVEAIYSDAFTGCTSLETLAVPESVKKIEADFKGLKKLVMVVMPGSYAETYAQKHNIPYELYGEGKHMTLKVTVKGVDGSSISQGYTVTWFQEGTEQAIGSGDTLHNAQEGEAYRCQITLEGELVYQYQPPEALRVVAEKGKGEFEAVLTPFGQVTVTGMVRDEDGEALEGAEILFRQSFPGGHQKEDAAATDQEGAFCRQLADVDTQVAIRAKGYYQQLFRVTSDKIVDGAYEIQCTLEPMPQNRVTLQVSMQEAAKEGEEAGSYLLSSTDGMEFTLFNETKGKGITEFTVQYPYLIVGQDAAGPQDRLRIAAVSKGQAMAAEPAEVVLDGNGCGTASLRFLQYGSLALEQMEGEGRHTVLVFDASGRLAESGTAGADYAGSPLEAGDYKVAVMEKTSLLHSVSQIGRLAECGLLEGEDYVQASVTIQDGVVAVLTGLKVPALDESKLYYTLPDETYFLAGAAEVAAGQYVTMRVKYEMDPKHDASGQAVQLEFPDGIVFVGSSLSVNGKPAAYSVEEGGRIRVPVNQPSGFLRFYALVSEPGEQAAFAYLDFQSQGGRVTQPIGSAVLDVCAAQMALPKKTMSQSVSVAGRAIAGCEVTVYDNGTEVGKTISRKNGTWGLSFDLVDPGSYSYHTVYATVKSSAHGVDMKTEQAKLIYDQGYAEVEKLTMVNFAHDAKMREFVTVFDFRKHDYIVPTYNYWPNYPTFTFRAEFDGDEDLISGVYVITKDASGDKTYVKCTYDKFTGTWIGSHDYLRFSDVPHGVCVRYCYRGIEVTDAYFSQVDGMLGQGLGEIKTVWEEMTDSALDGMAYCGTAKTEVPVRIEKEKGTLAGYDISALKEQGYEAVLDNGRAMGLVSPQGDTAVYLLSGEDSYILKAEIGIGSLVEEILRLPAAGGAQRASSGNRPAGAICTRCNEITLPDLIHLAQKAAGDLEGVDDLAAAQILDATRKIKKLLACGMAESLVLFVGNTSADGMAGSLASQVVQAAKGMPDSASYLGAAIKQNVDFIMQFLREDPEESHSVKKVSGYGYLYECDGGEDCDCGGELCSCGQGGDDGDGEPGAGRSIDSVWKPAIPIIDPSGYVYEAVPSNRIEGVKAEIYQYDYAMDEFGVPKDTKEEIFWDAENYGQVNPLYTDVEGTFAWDVPQGQWAVKFSKEGYYDANSYQDVAADEEGYLPVPPIQTEVNTAIISKAAPEVESIAAYRDGVRIAFSQYMEMDTIKTGNISIRCGGKQVSGKIVPQNAEYNYEKTTQYATDFMFVPDTVLSGAVTVSIQNVKNYHGTPLKQAVYVETAVESKPEAIQVEEALELPYQAGMLLHLQILPKEAGAGKRLAVNSLSPSIASVESESVQADENGCASILLKGNLPGKCEVSVSLEGTDLTASTAVTVSPVNAVAQKVSIENGTYAVTLSEDAFTYDGTPKQPAVTVEGLEEKDYMVSYSENVEAGTGRVNVFGVGDYVGVLTKEFTIEKASQTLDASMSPESIFVGEKAEIKASGKGILTCKSDNESVAAIESSVVAGSSGTVTESSAAAIENKGTVRSSAAAGSSGTAGEDGAAFTIVGKKAGMATITVTASGGQNYQEASRKFTITVKEKQEETKDISSYPAKLSASSYTYDGQPKTPKVEISGLTEGTDYKVSYSSNTDAGTATVTITGQGRYTGTLVKTFTIEKASQTLDASMSPESIFVGEKAEIKASGKGTLTCISDDESVAAVESSIAAGSSAAAGSSGTAGEDGVAFTIVGKKAGTATISVTASGGQNYKEASREFTITVEEKQEETKDISAYPAKLSASSYTYDGQPKTPKLEIDGLAEGTDYVVSYYNNTNAGTATATATGKGSYTGTLSRRFTIDKASQTVNAAISAKKIPVKKTAKITVKAVGTLAFRSSDPKVAKVNSKGIVTGAAAGKATITVTAAGSGNYKSASASLSIQVIKQASAPKPLKKGSKFSSGSIEYKVTKPVKGKNPGQAIAIGFKGKKISKAVIPAKAKAPTGEAFQVVSIAAKAFAGNKTLTSVTIGNSVKTISKNAFKGCRKLKAVTIGTGTQTVGDAAFAGCPKLAKITIKSQKLKKVGKNAIAGIHKKAVIKVPAKSLKKYRKLFSKKTGKKPLMAIKK